MSQSPPNQLWQAVLGQLQMQMTRATFDTWIKDSKVVSQQDDKIVVGVNSEFARDWLANRLFTVVERTTRAVFGYPVTIEYVVHKKESPSREVKPIPPPDENFLTLLSAQDILTTEWPEPVWVVPGFLPEGLSILAGKPKIGKSWLALQLAQAVANGSTALGGEVEKGSVLYLALEDPPRRLKDRMQRQQWPLTNTAEFMILGRFTEEIGDLGTGGGEILAQQIRLKKYRLVIIDTLSRAVGGNQNDVEIMTIALAPIHEIAHRHNCAVMLIDHHRKISSFYPDAVADILGSTAKGAMIDTAWGLYRERGQSSAKLAVTGREIEERTLAINLNHKTGCWRVEGDANQLEITNRFQEILDALEVLEMARASDVAKATGQNKGSAYRRLQDLLHANRVNRIVRDGEILYTVAKETG